MMNILALETSTDACSVAMVSGDAVYEVHEIRPRQHTDLLFGMIEHVLAAAGVARSALDLIAFGRGPGAFTGVRIAAGVAQGIALACDRPLAPVSSLAALAAGAARLYGARQVLAALDARRGEIYLAALRFDHAEALGHNVIADCVLAPEAVAIAGPAQWLAVGNGWSAYHARFAADIAAIPRADLLYPHAQDVARLGRALHERGASVAVADALPVYLRGAVD
jgi:tRNA threonylcarbamoyladenosine biosynthesis protein TsaB